MKQKQTATTPWYAEEIKAGKNVTIEYGESTCHGVHTAEARWGPHLGPIGTVWFTHRGKNTIEINGSYVQNTYRRLGVRTRIHKEMLKWYPKTKAIVTAEGTEFSTPWLKKMGFKQNEADGWRLDVV